MSSISGDSHKEVQSDPGVMKISTSGTADQYVTIGKHTYHKHELMEAFGGSLNPGYAPFPTREFGNPSPLGLCGFALTTFVLSMINAQAMGIKVSNVVVGLACFYGGFAQFCAGIWEGFVGNTFAMCALTSYGGFWLSFAAINIEAFGIASAYEDHEGMLADAIGFFLVGWAIFTFMLTLCTLKSTVMFCSLFSFLTMTFVLLAAGEFTGKVGVTRAGGVFGVITAFIAFYNAFAGTANSKNSYITAKPIRLPWVR
ncbi:hypothetical protein METBIDRAFT_79129 [Metschnikowia bicuspidata var. bicuspidata NRRL YB-4993]|uniref:Uncharacterized protein n=1 Tax=Metschnikowia bicuspidata var. bicuspidata NRRL YB-4993 TaxID=869754 RepID=A0A1A0H6P2_9ASCO|nr:hypothetical protein METBIDRAFT_79129 [Metschnikowia bicuspidata var. bicuspidata NRRL YB-4993]OBA19759.1 hypothetical protein METBIDRAFT_79129 [Metschnikowia bicuspidata var. bicuspidata NRRL YB-4993]